LVARRHGIEVEEIDLWLLGGVSRMRGEAHDPRDELRYALAGPAVTAVIAAAFGLALALLPSSTPAAVRALVEYQVLVNGLIFVFNLMPAFPLDGGRVLRSLLWRRSGQIGRSTETAAGIGRGFGYVLVALGALEFLAGGVEGLWLALIGFFLVMASGEQARGAEVQAALSDVHASDLMSAPVVSIPEQTSAAQAGRDYFLPYRYTAFPVVDGRGRALGLVSMTQLEALTPAQRAGERVLDVAERDPQLIVPRSWTRRGCSSDRRLRAWDERWSSTGAVRPSAWSRSPTCSEPCVRLGSPIGRRAWRHRRKQAFGEEPHDVRQRAGGSGR